MRVSRRSRTRAFAPDPDAPPGRGCDIPGCLAAGQYRAPKSRAQLRDYWWFCLEHVRGYNASWDYYQGMTPAQIELNLRQDAGWDRPTWPLGRLGTVLDQDVLRDPLGALNGGLGKSRSRREEISAELRKQLAVLDLEWPVTLEDVKIRYKALAKRYHPDANGGDPVANERVKAINLAYSALKTQLLPRLEPKAG